MLIDQLLAQHLSTLMAKVGGDLIGKVIFADGEIREIKCYLDHSGSWIPGRYRDYDAVILEKKEAP